MAPILRYNAKWSEVLIGGGGERGGTQQRFTGNLHPEVQPLTPFTIFVRKRYSFCMPPNDKLYPILITSLELLASLLTTVLPLNVNNSQNVKTRRVSRLFHSH